MPQAGGRLVIALDSANPRDVTLLGGKGAGLAEMREMGIAVPPGFVISTEVCSAYLATGSLTGQVRCLIREHLASIEHILGRNFGDPKAPLLVSVRSGAPVSMPGMMDTVLNLGLTEITVAGLAQITGDERFAQDCYQRLLRSYGITVRGMDSAAFDTMRARSAEHGSVAELQTLARAYLGLIDTVSGHEFPQDPWVQLEEAVGAVFASWNSPRAVRYRRYAGIDNALGSAVVVQAMVFGNLGNNSGTGVAFTRDPATGAPHPYGDFLANAQGEDVVAGEHDVTTLEECRVITPEAHRDLHLAMSAVEKRRRDMCEVEFTIENGRLWMLQTRVGQRTGTAAVRIALDLIDQGLISETEAISRIPPSALARLHDPVLDPHVERVLIGKGLAASPGAAVGRVALSSDAAEEMASTGIDAVLVRSFTSPVDIAGMIAARGVVTSSGGRTSHAAVVARGMNRPAVCGVRTLEIVAGLARFGSINVREGDEISIDGALGDIYLGAVPLIDPKPDPRVEILLQRCDMHRAVPVLCQGERAPWADGVFDPDGSAACRDIADLQVAAERGCNVLVLDLGASETAKALVNAALHAAAERKLTLLVSVANGWPPGLAALPPGPWAGIVATARTVMIARLVAATTKHAA